MSAEPADIQAKSKEFLDKAKAGTLDESSLKWGLSAGAIVTAVSLPLNYLSFGGFGMSVSFTGLDILRMREGYSFSLSYIGLLCIPLSAILGLYLHFGEPNMKLLKMETPGRPKLIYLIALIMAALGIFSCFDFLRVQVCLGSAIGTAGLALLAFVYFKLWQMAPGESAAPGAPPAPPVPPAAG